MLPIQNVLEHFQKLKQKQQQHNQKNLKPQKNPKNIILTLSSSYR